MKVVNWLIDNKEWVFSGIGLTVASIFCKLIFFKEKKNSDKKVHKQKTNSSFSIKGFFNKVSIENSSLTIDQRNENIETKTSTEELKEKAPKAGKSVIKKTVFASDDYDIEMSSTERFDYRIRRQFPGVRGVKCFTYRKKIGERLCALLMKPSKNMGRSYFWWFRGSSSMHITDFSIINRKKCLMDCQELIIDKIYVYISGTYWRDFIYVITKPDKPTGLYNISKKIEGIQTNEYGNYYEEFGLYGKKKMTRHEYDDGAFEKKGKLIQTDGSENLRVRYLAPYNFIICAHDSPINNNSYDGGFKEILNGILNGENSVDDIIEKVKKMPKRDREWRIQ